MEPYLFAYIQFEMMYLGSFEHSRGNDDVKNMKNKFKNSMNNIWNR